MTDKKLTNLYIAPDVIEYYTKQAIQELEDEGEDVNKISMQRRRARIMVEVLTERSDSGSEEE